MYDSFTCQTSRKSLKFHSSKSSRVTRFLLNNVISRHHFTTFHGNEGTNDQKHLHTVIKFSMQEIHSNLIYSQSNDGPTKPGGIFGNLKGIMAIVGTKVIPDEQYQSHAGCMT
jgi:hypothetical protein